MSEPKRFTGRQVTVMVTAVCAAVVALPAGVFAATGGTFVLGHSNSAGHTTALKNSGTGAALSLAAAKSSTPVLSVGTNKARIPNLDADLLDGLHASSLQRRVSGTCAKGSSVASIKSSGGVTCDPNGVAGFAAPGTYSYTPPAGVTHVVVEIWAGGGRAGGQNFACGASAGGEGGYVRALVPVTPGHSYVVTVGAGGAGAAPATSNCDATGQAGGDSSFTAAIAAKGGQPGSANGLNEAPGGAGGGTAVTAGAPIVETTGQDGTSNGPAVPGGGLPGGVGSGGASKGSGIDPESGDAGVAGLVIVEPLRS